MVNRRAGSVACGDDAHEESELRKDDPAAGGERDRAGQPVRAICCFTGCCSGSCSLGPPGRTSRDHVVPVLLDQGWSSPGCADLLASAGSLLAGAEGRRSSTGTVEDMKVISSPRKGAQHDPPQRL